MRPSYYYGGFLLCKLSAICSNFPACAALKFVGKIFVLQNLPRNIGTCDHILRGVWINC